MACAKGAGKPGDRVFLDFGVVVRFGAVEAGFEIDAFAVGVVAQIAEQVGQDGFGIFVEFLAAFLAGGVFVKGRVRPIRRAVRW